MKEITATHILAKVNVYDEWFDEGATCVLIPIESLERARAYGKQIERIKEDGLCPAKISEYNCSPVWMRQMLPVTPEFAERIIVIDDNNTIDHDYGDWGLGVVCGTDDELEENKQECTTDCEMLNAYPEMFSVTCNAKHTEIEMEAIIYYSQLDNAPTLAEVLARREVEA